MTVLNSYKALCEKGVIESHPEQWAILQVLQSIADGLVAENKKRSGFLSYFRTPRTVKGLYLWGHVGVGKTLLLDCFYQSLPFDNKKRMHFYQFMLLIHEELHKLQGVNNPLTIIAKNIAKEAIVLCFDEFIMTDTVDALILKSLLCELFRQGVCLVTTSNKSPELICKPAWRENFLPAIQAIHEHMVVAQIECSEDYRKSTEPATATIDIEKQFAFLTQHHKTTTEAIVLYSRTIPVIKRSDTVAWFDFNVLCSSPRSHHDYLMLARDYKTICLSTIPIIPAHADNTISLFIRLVDVLYDAGTQFVFTSEAPIEQLYTQGKFIFEYQRTCSRLTQMSSQHLLESNDRPSAF